MQPLFAPAAAAGTGLAGPVPSDPLVLAMSRRVVVYVTSRSRLPERFDVGVEAPPSLFSCPAVDLALMDGARVVARTTVEMERRMLTLLPPLFMCEGEGSLALGGHAGPLRLVVRDVDGGVLAEGDPLPLLDLLASAPASQIPDETRPWYAGVGDGIGNAIEDTAAFTRRVALVAALAGGAYLAYPLLRDLSR